MEALKESISAVNTDLQTFKAASNERDKTLFASLGRLEKDVKRLLLSSNGGSGAIQNIQHKVWFVSGVLATAAVVIFAMAWLISNIDKIQIVSDKLTG